MVQVVVVYHSGYGHTAKVAQAVGEGVLREAGASVIVVSVDAMDEAVWAALDRADAIIFGAPTYMGSISAKFKSFIEAASKRWSQQVWKDKVAAGFTNAGAYAGDNFSSLIQLLTNAMQHSMIWVGTGLKAPTPRGDGPTGDDINRVGSFIGVATQSNDESPDITPPVGDLETARLLGQRVAVIAAQMARGRE
jgi:NAD(P)H dehydrogenase (quinone)